MSTNQPAKMRWGELEEDEGDDLDFLLPPKQVIGPDENGIKKVIQYMFKEDGNKLKVTTTIRVRKLADVRLSKRRSWSKFGDAALEGGSQDFRTVVSCEEVIIERSHPPGVGPKTLAAFYPASSRNQSNTLMACRTCGKKRDHWSVRCPFKNLRKTPDYNDKPSPLEPSARTNKSTYVSPHLRTAGGAVDRGSGSNMRRKNDENLVRVTNLSKDTREPDLLELFSPFGNVSRVYIAVDQKTGISRGFGFVNFFKWEDAQRAINKLNGYGYDNLILQVEWATPRAN